MYSKTSKGIHWIVAVLIALAFLLAWTREELPKGALRSIMLDWHQWAGLGVLLLLVPRVVGRSRLRPNPVALLPFWQRAGAVSVEGALYAMMLLQPLLGWVLAGAKGRSVSLIGIPLPPLAATDKVFAKQLGEWHETAGYLILVLIGLHVLAALYHRFWLKDGILASMLGSWVGPRRIRDR